MYYAACKTTEATFFFRNMTQSTFKLWLIGQFPDHLNHFIYEVRSMLLDRWSCLGLMKKARERNFFLWPWFIRIKWWIHRWAMSDEGGQYGVPHVLFRIPQSDNPLIPCTATTYNMLLLDSWCDVEKKCQCHGHDKTVQYLEAIHDCLLEYLSSWVRRTSLQLYWILGLDIKI
jgi:hypothetical protein